MAAENLLDHRRRQPLVLVENRFLGDRIHQLRQNSPADQLGSVDRNLLDPCRAKASDQGFGQFRPFPDQRFLASLLRHLTGTFEAMMNLRIQLAKELTLDHPDLFDRVIHLEQVIAGVAEGFEQNRGRHLPASIDPDVQNVPRIKLEIQP